MNTNTNNRYKYLIIGLITGVVVTILAYQLFNGTSKDVAKINNDNIKKEETAQITTVKLSDNVINEFGIIIKTTGPGKIEMHTDLTGEIVPNPYKVAHIIPRFPGVVKKVYKKIGDKIKKGETIAVIESNESLVQYKVKSSINGTILVLHMTPGELIGDGTHVVEIADLSSVWAELNVYQEDLMNINVGQQVVISSLGSNYKIKSNIFYIDPTVNEKTRTSVARVKLGNIRGTWKPGLFVNGVVKTKEFNLPLIVPKTAIETLNDQTVVFIETENGFKAQPVKIGVSNQNYVQILSGLKKGQKYVAKNGFVIKSEIEKSKFADED